MSDSSIRALIIGTGFEQLGLRIVDEVSVDTNYGKVKLLQVQLGDISAWVLPRHGKAHQTPPHLINYRANIAALKSIETTEIIAIAAVGGIQPNCAPSSLILPNQIVDYTSGRECTYSEIGQIYHTDFTHPFDEALRTEILISAKSHHIDMVSTGTYGVVQGPRLETKAEITRMKKDGCDMVGMTGMPEAILARELKMAYATIAISVNFAAGINNQIVDMTEIIQCLKYGTNQLKPILYDLFRA